MRTPPYPRERGRNLRTMAAAHAVDGAWDALMADAQFAALPMRPVARSAAYRAGELRLTVQCRRRVASVRRALAAAFPPYAVIAAQVVHP